MRWLMIVFLASLAVLLIAAAGMAHHIWVQRARIRFKPPVSTGHDSASALEPAKKSIEKTELKDR
jgi:hypothetical protein